MVAWCALSAVPLSLFVAVVVAGVCVIAFDCCWGGVRCLLCNVVDCVLFVVVC